MKSHHRAVLLLVMKLYAASTPVRAPITGCLSGVDACSCEWIADDTDATTLSGLSHPGDYSAAAIAATGLPEAVVKAADTSPQACELVCCEALVITDAPAAAQAPPQTGPCGVWQHGGGTGASGCWLGLDNTQRKPPLPEVPEKSGHVWAGGAGKRCRIASAANAEQVPSQLPADTQLCSANWGIYVLVLAAVAGTLYLGGGVAAGSRQGRGTGMTAHPHFKLWQELYGLALDGVEFARHARDGGSAKYMQANAATATAHSGGISGSGREKERNAAKERSKNSASSKRRSDKADKKAGSSGLGESLGSGATASTEDESAGQTAEERRHAARQLEERAQQGVHSSQAKVTVVGRR